MAGKYCRARRMSPVQKEIWQLAGIRKTYSAIIEHSERTNNGIICIMDITPSENSDTYKVEISYRYGQYPKAKLLSHKLEKRNGEYPHHKYGIDNNGYARLCVFCPGCNEWNSDMLISESFIPWISTWLNAYEFWLITGEWHYDEILLNGEKKEKGKCEP